MRRDFVITYLGEAALLACSLLIFKVVDLRFGADGFAEYALSRRIVSLLMPAALMGLGVGIPRYTAMAARKDSPACEGNYLLGGAAALLGAGLFFVGALALFPRFFAGLLLGSDQHRELILPIGSMIAGMGAYTAVYSHLRGRMSFVLASIQKVILLAAAPLAICFVAPRAQDALLGTGALWLGTSIALLFVAVRRSPPRLDSLWRDTKTLIAYGIRRVPGEFCMAGLLAAPTTLTAHLSGIRPAGNVAFATSVLTMLATAFGPLGLILLPKMSHLVAAGDVDSVRRHGNRLLLVAIAAPAVVVAVFEVFAGKILSLYLPNADPRLVQVCRIVILAGLFYPVYISLRSVLDALSARALNSMNTFFSLLFFATASTILYVVRPLHDPVLPAFVASIALLALLTVTTYRRALLTIVPRQGGAAP